MRSIRSLSLGVPKLQPIDFVRNQIDRFYFAHFLDSEPTNEQDEISFHFN